MNKLFNILLPSFSFKALNKIQRGTLQEICEKAENKPETLTPLEAFQIGRFTERALVNDDNYLYLKEIQKNIKIRLGY